ncbi:hypothetical protein SCLCIDRAFT_1221591 [Scleroderma citrinum Foug A]|uniref:Uncharacterized protein n=1 Tax=Scleroderma citrinum Foug A TaxID=1036808 RepID=A0A0C3DFL4_9AGAM|nr:hypothetical protein SCLCIDRAFT_1221591 [Scleroderma citrinum Foug A]
MVMPSSALLVEQPGPCHTSATRTALHDSTNTSSRPGKRSIGCIQSHSTKRVTFPTSSTRLPESNSRCCKFSASPPRFPVAYKAPPTVSISFSAACSQNRGFGFEAGESELPDVRNFVPFPCSPLDGNEDVEMTDGTFSLRPSPDLSIPCLSPSLFSLPPVRRKRRSACSSGVPSSRKDRSSKDPKDGSARKRARKSKRHGGDMWWLGVIHRSILQGLCEPEPTVSSCPISAFDGSGNRQYRRMRHNTFEAQDRLLAERIWQKLLDGGCNSVVMTGGHEGRTAAPLPSRLTLLSSPPIPISSVLMPSPIHSSPAPAVECRAESENMSSSNEVTVLKFPQPPCLAGKVLFYPKPSTPIAVPPLRNFHDDFQASASPSSPAHKTPLSCPKNMPTLLSSKFRRSPSPPLLSSTPRPSRSTTPTPQTPTTLTMPQLVASLTLVHRERSGLRSRGRSLKNSSNCSSRSMGKDACCTREPTGKESNVCIEDRQEGIAIPRSRESQAPQRCADRRSPLCRVVYTESLQVSCSC